jgi:5-methylcytosine-specific restriction endonuclease McrA
MNSSKWYHKRKQVLHRDDYRCKACEQFPATQVHHVSYIHFGDEPLFELVSVCKSCHAKLTKLDHARVKSDNLSDKVLQILIEK